MSRGPRVSIVMPFFNAERFMAEAIESVRAQSYPHWVLYTVDDGSADGSTTLAREYARRDPDRIRYVEHPGHANRGVSASRNAGLRQADGAYVAFLDADDVYHPDKLRDQVVLLEARPDAGTVYGSTLEWYSWTGQPEDVARDVVPALGVAAGRIYPAGQLVPAMLQRRVSAPSMSSTLVRRSMIEQAGGFEDAFTGMYEDQVWHLKLFLAAPVYVGDGRWDQYRRHAASCYSVAKRTGEWVAARRMFLEWAERYLTAQGVTDRAVWRALREELQPYRSPVRARASRAARRLLALLRTRPAGTPAA
ncbi:hypothetical protein tb265_16220 [Gemmatimonadetes bacterium T265]|nr:hypothetical protein tb265_16220 [Gemmatimonadetes bacterium T265]